MRASRTRRSLRSGAVALAFAALLAVGVAACGSSSSGTSSGESEASGSIAGKKVFIVGCYDAVPYCAKENEVMKNGLEAQGIHVTLLIDELNAAEEAAHIGQAVSQQANVILWVGNAQEAAHAALLKARQQQIPVLLIGTEASPDVEGLYTSYIGPNDFKSGELQAQMLTEGLQKAGVKSGKVILVTGTKGELAVTLRQEGWKKAMEKMPQYETVAEPDAAWDPVKAAQVTQPLFAKYGSEVVGASAFSGSMAAAVAQTAGQAGLKVGTATGDTVVAGLNCDGTSIKAIEEGKLYGTTSQGPVSEGETAVTAAVELLEGKKIPADIPVPNEPIYKSNVGKFARECNY